MATWENENKIYCKQTLIEGDGPKTYWTRELANDELILVRTSNPTIACTVLTAFCCYVAWLTPFLKSIWKNCHFHNSLQYNSHIKSFPFFFVFFFSLRKNANLCRFSLAFYCCIFHHVFTGRIIISGPLLLSTSTVTPKNLFDLLQIFSGEREIKAFDLISGEPSFYKHVFNVMLLIHRHMVYRRHVACCWYALISFRS